MKSIRNIINKEIDRFILDESLTDIVYHFTDYNRIFNIMLENRFNMAASSISSKDIKFSKGYKYFMCVTRQKHSRIGYSDSRGVRITLDGFKLNQRYKSCPVNYFYNDMGGGWSYDKERYYEWYENEDRILSNKKYIDNFSDYVLQVDICPYSNLHSINYKKEIEELIKIKSPYLDKIRIYTNSTRKNFDLGRGNYISIYEYLDYLNKSLKKDKKAYALEQFNNNGSSGFDCEFYLNNGIVLVNLDEKWNCISGGRYTSNKWFDSFYEALTYATDIFGELVISNIEPINDYVSKICVTDKFGYFKRYNLVNKEKKVLCRYDWFKSIGEFGDDGYAIGVLCSYNYDSLEDYNGDDRDVKVNIDGSISSDYEYE